MDTVATFSAYLNKFIELTDEEFEQFLSAYIHTRKFSKKEIIIRAGEVEDYFNFIVKGLVRKYYKKNHEEINTQISYEGHIILSEESFYTRTPSEYILEAIEPTTLVSIKYDDLENIFSKSQKMEHMGRLITMHTLMMKDRWQVQLLKSSPRERFLKFVEKSPELLQRVPQKHLASYLHIKPETFSRFKHLPRPSRYKSSIETKKF
ncbi:MAG TPA: Crp/Fnr family transcriptional regulator [Chitinophagaceae bacterium]|jgi:Cyclic nucleotide-binding domain.